MAISTPVADTGNSRAIAGIVCIELGTLLFAFQDGMMKALLGDFTVWMLILARAFVTVLILVPTILLLGGKHRLFSPLWPLHMVRALLFACGFSMFYTAFPFMGLAALTTIFFSAPLFTALLAVVFLGETVGVRRMCCLIVGFVGVVIAMNPTGESFSAIALLPFICAITYSISQIIARRIGDRETSLTLGLYTITLAGVFIIPLGFMINQVFELGPEFRHIHWNWEVPDPNNLLILLLLGVVGMAAYTLISRAYQIANASLIAPFDYSYLPIAALMGYLGWNEIPGWHTMAGMVMIAGSGLYLGYREIQQARRPSEPAPTAGVVFVPGSPTDGLLHSSDSHDQYDQPD